MSSPVPDTRESLILRLPDRQDVQAWDEFTAIYQPLVYRLARVKGFQHADAQELVQEVMLAVSRAVARWQPDAERGRFRDWLFTISRNLMINFLTRQKHRPLGGGDSGIEQLLHAQCDPACEQSKLYDLEYQREVFRLVAVKVRKEVNEKAWQAFWRSSVENQAIEAVASQLEMSVGAVYIARSRILARLHRSAAVFLNADHSESDELVRRKT